MPAAREERAPEQSARPVLPRFGGRQNPLLAIMLRFALAFALVIVNWVIVLVERGQYTDSYDGTVSAVDALYYTTVTLTTTGYGDIVPVTTGARLINALLVTPMRLIFVVLLVGTTIKALTSQSRDEIRLYRWRKRMRDHVVVLGWGTKGRNAVRALLQQGVAADRIVVVDRSADVIADASASGHTGVRGWATDEAVLRQALVDRAKTVIVALGRDDTAILTTLTVRRISPTVGIVATARESRNAELLQQSGANQVIVSSETAGRLLGLATTSPETVAVVEDLLSFGQGLDLVQRPAHPDEIGQGLAALPIPVLAVLRDGRVLAYNDPDALTVRSGDHLVYASA